MISAGAPSQTAIAAAAAGGGGSAGTTVVRDNPTGFEWPATMRTGVGYGGLGAIYGPAVAYYGLRAFNATAAASRAKAIQLQRASDGATQDITVLPNGRLDLATAASFLAGTTGGLSIWYDQSGNGYHMAQATQSLQPKFAFNAIGSLPGVTFNSSAGTFLEFAAGIPNTYPPVTYSHFMQPQMSTTRNVNYFPTDSVNGGNQGYQVDGSGNRNFLAFFSSTNTVSGIINNAWHSVQLTLVPGSSASNIYFDGTSNAETFSITSGTAILSGSDSLGCDISGVGGPYTAYFNGIITELGIFNTAPSTAEMAAAYADQTNTWSLQTTPGPPANSIEWDAAVRLDAGDLIEFPASVSRDISPPFEFLTSHSGTGVNADTVIDMELQGAAVADITPRFELTGGTRADSGYPVESSGRLIVDPRTTAEVLAALRLDLAPGLEFVPAIKTDKLISVEWSGGVQVARDTFIAEEWAAELERDTTGGAETVAILTAKQNGALEWIGTLRRDQMASAEGLASLLSDLGMPFELLSSGAIIILDTVLPIESVGSPPAVVFSVETGPGRVRLLATPGRLRLLRRN